MLKKYQKLFLISLVFSFFIFARPTLASEVSIVSAVAVSPTSVAVVFNQDLDDVFLTNYHDQIVNLVYIYSMSWNTSYHIQDFRESNGVVTFTMSDALSKDMWAGGGTVMFEFNGASTYFKDLTRDNDLLPTVRWEMTEKIVSAEKIIIDHNSVALYDKIPSQYMTLVKQMWFNMPGESHGTAYPNGLRALQTQNSTYAINETAPGNGNTGGTGLSIAGYLWNGGGWDSGAGEEDWFYNGSTKPQGHVAKVSATSYRSSILGLGWCWDDYLTPTDFDNYIKATQGYSTFAKSLGRRVKIVFTTGPIDGGGSANRDEKYRRVRNHVDSSSDEILFDYADILQYNNAGNIVQATYGTIHPDNMQIPSSSSHIGTTGELRLAKAAWVLMARLAGWDGSTGDGDTTLPVVSAFTIPTQYSRYVPIQTFTATDNSGTVTGYQITETSTKPSASGLNWFSGPQPDYVFATTGQKTLYAWAKDAAGNFSNSKSATVNVFKQGDFNYSGKYEAIDVNSMINIILKQTPTADDIRRGDMDDHQDINALDLNALITEVLRS